VEHRVHQELAELQVLLVRMALQELVALQVHRELAELVVLQE
jgi:hypothetical protein